MSTSLELPASALPVCLKCGSQVDPRNSLVLREVVGFSRERDQGGQNHVRHRHETGRYLCPTCDMRWRDSGDPNQGSLL